MWMGRGTGGVTLPCAHLCSVIIADVWRVHLAQVAQSCSMLEMHADIKSAPGTADEYDFAIVGAQEAVAALRYNPPARGPLLPRILHSKRLAAVAYKHVLLLCLQREPDRAHLQPACSFPISR